MPLNERNRSILYRRLSDMVGDEEAVGEMMSYFPARDVEEPATKEFVRAEIADLRVDTARQVNRLIMWMVGVNAAQLGLILTLVR